jgi:hypothetical protein
MKPTLWIAAGLSGLATLAAFWLAGRPGDWFAPYFGTLSPPLTVAGLTGCGVIALGVLTARQDVADGHWPPSGTILRRLLPWVSGFSAVAIASDLAWHFACDINVPWPDALVFYPTIAVVAEMLFHVIPLAIVLPLFAWAFRRWSAYRRYLAAAVLISVPEPAFQIWPGLVTGSITALDAITAANVFAFTLFQLHVFRRHGFLAMLTVRLLYYALWHLGWGALRLNLLF